MNRFDEEQTKELAAIADSLQFTRLHLAGAEALRIDELPLDEYERDAVATYRSQLRAVAAGFERLLDLRLEQSPEADRLARAVSDGFDLALAMQGEIASIVDGYYQQHLQEHSGGNEQL
jgi:hypothetical protein